LIEELTPRQTALMDLAEHTEQYIEQESRKQRKRPDRPDNFGDVDQSRRDAFQ